MWDIEKISVTELAHLLKEKKAFVIKIPDGILGFKKAFQNIDFSKSMEVAPTYVDTEVIAAVLTHSKNGPEGLYIQMVALVYASGGKIFYQENTSDIFDATVDWTKSPPS